MDALQIVGIAVALIFGYSAWVVMGVMQRKRPERKVRVTHENDFDVIIVGASIAGPVAAKRFSDQGRKVALIERDGFEKPNRIVGELLQPGGINLLKKTGMESCLDDIGVTCTGYVTIHNGEWVQLPYKENIRGKSFHFGDFVQNLRKYVRNNCSDNVSMLSGSVKDVIIEGDAAIGVEFTPKDGDGAKKLYAPLVVMCDGGGSKFRKHAHYSPAAQTHSHFVGVILKDIQMPYESRGHVFLGKSGPILSYRLDENEVRILAAVSGTKLPAGSPEGIGKWLNEEVKGQLPESFREGIQKATEDHSNIRSMPISHYQQTFPSIRGLIGLGDHNNQRHPLTGGGMTCAMRDAYLVTEELKGVKSLSADASKLQDGLIRYTRTRNRHSATINILSWALYEVFSGPESMRQACFTYFQLGGECVDGPMALLSGLESSASVLLYHYVRVMIYGAWVLMYNGSLKNLLTFFINPVRIADAIYLLAYSTYVFAPLAFTEFCSIWRYLDPTRFIPRTLGKRTPA